MKKYIAVGVLISIVLVLFFLIKPFIAIGVQNINISSDQWKEDIVFLRDTLPQKHPNIYSYMPEEKYSKDFNDLISDIDDLEPYQILGGIQTILAKINDPHTYIDYTVYESLPLEVYCFDEGLYIIGADSEYREIIGAKILSIGTDDIDTIAQKISSLSPNLNESCLQYYIADNIINPYVLKYFNNMKGRTVQFKLQAMGGEIFSKTISLKSKTDIDLVYTSDLIRERPFYLRKDDRHWYTLLDDHTLYYQDNAMIPNAVGREVIDAVKENDIDKLVIDLRKNSGGMYINQKKFIKTIGKLQSERKFRIYILMGRVTFSSSVSYIHDFVTSTDCILAGEPPRTGYNHYGDQRTFRLPHSKANIKYSTTFFNIADHDSDEIIPDIAISSRFMDYAGGVDAVLDAISAE